MAPPLDRRDFLRGIAAIGIAPAAATALTACGSNGGGSPTVEPPPPGSGGGNSSTGNLTEPPEFDFPLVLPLPFAHGVASGDPMADRVIIWTRITESTPSASQIPVRWAVSSTPDFSSPLRSGEQITQADRDWTVKVDVTGLQPATTYYYQFEAFGRRSIIGRTRTAPRGAVDSIRVAVMSCSSYWSSHWSGFANLADRNDLDLVIHCGDYIYDFVDEDEAVRARKGRADTADIDYRDWLDLQELRRRYALWRSDPSLMRAHQQHPWFIVWDNHDIDPRYGNELPTPFDGQTGSTTLAQTTQAFWEWTPSRPVKADGSGEFLLVDDGRYPMPPDSTLVWRRLRYGELLDVFGLDTQIGLPRYQLTLDSGHLASGNSLMGRRQFEWLVAGMRESSQAGVTWRLLNNQTWIAPVDIPDLIDGVPTAKLGISRWTDYPEERAALFQALRGDDAGNDRVRNNIVVSGDAHGNLGSDLIESTAFIDGSLPALPVPNPRPGSTPLNTPAGWGRASTGNLPGLNQRAASVGVEFAPSSMGRGGADELVSNALQQPAGGLESILGARALELALITGNKNVQFIEWVDHGYGIVDLNTERAIFEYWWQDKLTPDAPDVLGRQMISWARSDSGRPIPRHPDQIDDVTAHGLSVMPTEGTRSAPPAPLDRSAVNPR